MTKQKKLGEMNENDREYLESINNNKDAIPKSIGQYTGLIYLLGVNANKEFGNNNQAYEISRQFECLIRDKLALATFDVPQDGDAFASDDDEGEIAEAIKKRNDGASLYLKCALEIVKKKNWEFVERNTQDTSLCLPYMGQSEKKVRIDRNTNETQENLTGIRYVAFYALCTYLRRQKLNDEWEKLYYKYSGDFSDFTSLAHIRLENIPSDKLKKEHLKESYELVEKMKNQGGVQMMFANHVVQYCEKNKEWAYSTQGQKYLEQAKDAIESAIEGSEINYPKAYIIQARVYEKLEYYSEAIESVKKGIRMHETNSYKNSDYIERLAEFYDYQFNITIKEQLADVEQKRKALESEIKDKEIRSLEVMGLFAAIISITIGGIEAATRALDASFLFLLFGVIIIAFTTFHLLINIKALVETKKEKWRQLITVLVSYAIGIVLIFEPEIKLFILELL